MASLSDITLTMKKEFGKNGIKYVVNYQFLKQSGQLTDFQHFIINLGWAIYINILYNLYIILYIVLYSNRVNNTILHETISCI
jgi:hypothetical protein